MKVMVSLSLLSFKKGIKENQTILFFYYFISIVNIFFFNYIQVDFNVTGSLEYSFDKDNFSENLIAHKKMLFKRKKKIKVTFLKFLFKFCFMNNIK